MSDEFIEEEAPDGPPKRTEEEEDFIEEFDESPPEEDAVTEDSPEEVEEEEPETVFEDLPEEDVAEEDAAEEEIVGEEAEPVFDDAPDDGTEWSDDAETGEADASDDLFESDDEAADDSDEYTDEFEESGDEDVYEEDAGEDGDSYTETSEEGWLGRLGSAIKGVVIGGLIFLIGFPILFWNEGRAVKRYKTLKEGAGAVISVSPDKVDAANNGKLIHLTGLATTKEILTDGEKGPVLKPVSVSIDKVDPKNEGKLVHVTGLANTTSKIPDKEFGFSVPAIKLERTVEMYQWKEARGSSQTDKKLGGKKVTKTQYKYGKTWSDELVNSSRFKQPKGHDNPTAMPYKEKRLATKNVTVGAFKLSPDFIRELNQYDPIRFKKLPGSIPAALQGKVHLDKGNLFIGADPNKPVIGDVRIKYRRVKPLTVSLMAKQQGGVLAPYAGKDGKKVSQMVIGSKSAADMLPPAGISVNAIKLKRTVAMYQWKEEKSTKKDSNGKKKTVYKYKKEWSEQAVDSTAFKNTKGHNNPGKMPFEGKLVTAKKVTVGAFDLTPKFVGSLSRFEALPVDAVTAALPESLRSKAKVIKGGYFIGKDPNQPQIGDIKISYSTVKPQQVSLIAQQTGKTFTAYKSKYDGTIEEFRTGNVTADQIFGQEQKSNKLMAWLLRLAGLIAMFIGLTMVFKPLSVVMDVIPFLGNLAEKGIAIVAFLIASFFALITIAIAWLFYRPLLAILLIAAAVGLVFGVKMLKNKKSGSAAPPAGPSAPPQMPGGGAPPPPPGS